MLVAAVLSSLLALAAACAPGRVLEPRAAGPRVVGYLASWGVRTKGVRIADLPASRLTHLFYAFGGVDSTGAAVLGDACLDVGACAPGAQPTGGNFAELRALKRRNPNLRVLISLGGWGGSAHFSNAAATSESRRRLAASAVDVFLRPYDGLFDGVDVDWEFPVAGGPPENRARPEDRRNFTLLLAEMRRALDALGRRTGRRYELTIAASARPAEIANLELDRLPALLDWMDVMAYDYHSVDTLAHFNAPLHAAAGDPTPGLNVDASLRAFLDGGVPAEKLVLGIPFYGRGYGGVADVGDGLFQRGERARAGEWGELDYRALVARDPQGAGFRRFWQPQAMVPWLFDPRSGTWISYDDPQSVALKAAYARERGLGGVMFWEIGGDDGTLLTAIHSGLEGAAPGG
jgi:chitinase